jgi:molecular chaperone GrpE
MKQGGRTRDTREENPEKAFSVIDRRPAFGDETEATAEPRYPSVVEELKARAEEAERRAREISAAYRRIEEERDAFRMRLTRDLERRVDIARVDMMGKVLGVLDDLNRAIAVGAGEPGAGPLLSGVTLIRDHLMQILASEGVQALDLVGQRFDPAVAEAVLVEETDDPARDNLILEESGRGYTLGATLLRPARVRVARCSRVVRPDPPLEETAQAEARSDDTTLPGPGSRVE